jgi:hypothetical protein
LGGVYVSEEKNAAGSKGVRAGVKQPEGRSVYDHRWETGPDVVGNAKKRKRKVSSKGTGKNEKV